MDSRNSYQYNQERLFNEKLPDEPRLFNPDRMMYEDRPSETYIREDRTDRSNSFGANNQDFQYNSRRDTNVSEVDSLLDLEERNRENQPFEDRDREKQVFGEHYWDKNVETQIPPSVSRKTPEIYLTETTVRPMEPEVYLPPKVSEFENPAFRTETVVRPAEPEVYLPPKMAEYEMDNRRNHGGDSTKSEDRPIISQQQADSQPCRSRPLFPVMRDIVLWRDLKISGLVFSSGLVALLALSYFSFISVFAYTSLAILILAGGLVMGRQIMFALQKRQAEHPFRKMMEKDVVINPEYLHSQVDNLLYPANKTLTRLRNLYLADNLAQTLKMMLYMYVLTYVGSWFNLMTLAIVGWMGAFSVPKVYVMYRPQIDRVLVRIRGAVKQAVNRAEVVFNQQREKIQAKRQPVKSEVKTTVTKVEKVQ